MNLPTPHQLSESPELGVLALLDFAHQRVERFRGLDLG